MHYVLFCMPEISPSKLYLLHTGTDVNRYRCLIVRCKVHFNNYIHSCGFFSSFLHRSVVSNVVSIDLSHHLDGADDDISAARFVSFLSF